MISQSFLVLTQISSTYACGETPFSAALRSIFWPCSSRPRQEERIVSLQALKARQGIGRRGAVGVADVQVVAGVIDGRGHVEGALARLVAGFTHGRFPSSSSCAAPLRAAKKRGPSAPVRGERLAVPPCFSPARSRARKALRLPTQAEPITAFPRRGLGGLFFPLSPRPRSSRPMFARAEAAGSHRPRLSLGAASALLCPSQPLQRL